MFEETIPSIFENKVKAIIRNDPSPAVGSIQIWIHYLFCYDNEKWSIKTVAEELLRKDPIRKLRAASGLMRIYVKRVLLEKRGLTDEEEEYIVRGYNIASKALDSGRYPHAGCLQSLVNIDYNLKRFLEIAFEIYK